MLWNKDKKTHTIAFYNVENLFDTKNDPDTFDDDFTTDGRRKWNEKRYRKKIDKLTSVISKIGNEETSRPPVIIGLVEVENEGVVNDLIKHPNLQEYYYDFVHYDSPDERGIDVALVYDKTVFEFLESKTFPLLIDNEFGERDYTRDVLLVKGNLKGELVWFLVNHWPSRRSGSEETNDKRIEASKLVRTIISDIENKEEGAKIIVMGDFNDDPVSESVKEYLVKDTFFNPMESLYDKGNGTTVYKGKWNLFDQIIFSRNFLGTNEGLCFRYAEVYNEDWLRVFKGKLKDSPFRTYVGPWYKGGFSDHFPVYAYFEK